jgi:hypothetical protein
LRSLTTIESTCGDATLAATAGNAIAQPIAATTIHLISGKRTRRTDSL